MRSSQHRRMEAMFARIYRYALQLHRWLALAFAVPLLVVIATGLVLSFEPIAQQMQPEQQVRLSDVEAHLLRFDPEGRANSLAIRTYDNTMTIGGVGARRSMVVNLATGEEASLSSAGASNAGWWDIFLTARRMHETLLLDLGGLVTASTVVMLVIAVLGMTLGWPRLRHSLRGWHQCVAWVTLPLLILSPLTGLALAFGVTFMASNSGGGSGGGRVPLRDAVRLVAADHSLANLTSIRQRGGRLMARIFVDGELRGYSVTPKGLQPLQRNWPRLLHEGNWGGVVGPAANVLTSLALLFLIGSGVTLWITRTRRRLVRAATQAASAVSSGGAARPSVPGA